MEDRGKLTKENRKDFKKRILSVLSEGGQSREANERIYFYDKGNLYQGYCLKTEWEELVLEEDEGTA